MLLPGAVSAPKMVPRGPLCGQAKGYMIIYPPPYVIWGPFLVINGAKLHAESVQNAIRGRKKGSQSGRRGPPPGGGANNAAPHQVGGQTKPPKAGPGSPPPALPTANTPSDPGLEAAQTPLMVVPVNMVFLLLPEQGLTILGSQKTPANIPAQ